MNARLVVRQTPEYRRWRTTIRDPVAGGRIDSRVFRLEAGLFGRVRGVGAGVSELKLDFGPGFRTYFARKGNEIILLLCGGDKSTQSRDIDAAHTIWEQWKDKL